MKTKRTTYSFAICENVNDVLGGGRRRRSRRTLPAVQISLSKTVNKMYIHAYTCTCMYT